MLINPHFLLALSTVPLSTLAADFTTRSWADSVALAQSKLPSLSLSDKVGILTGVGDLSSRCIGNIHPVANASIPAICYEDGPAGVRATKNVSAFPPGIGVAATFSRSLMRARGVAIGEEFRGKGIHVFLGPAMDVMRNPKAGRGWESFGPDPYLNGEGAFETITGVQSVGVQACAKHFIANVQEHFRYQYTSQVDDRTLHEVYLWPFLRAFDANVSALMCAYNQINSTYACGNSALLNNSGLAFKNGFQGYTLSDWGATHEPTDQYANAGLDMEQPGDFILIGGGVYGLQLELAVTLGTVSQARLDEMVTRVLASFYRLGQDQNFPPTNFDAQHPDGSGSLNLGVSVRSDAHTALIRQIAGASTVLLKNQGGTLPFKDTEPFGSMAIIGLDAGPPDTTCNLNECDDGVVTVGYGSGTTLLDFVIPPVTSLTEKAAGSNTAVTTSLTQDVNDAKAAALGKDVAFVFVNTFSGENPLIGTVDGTFGDRNDLDLFFKGGSLIEAVASVNNNTVVVIHSVGPFQPGPWVNMTNVTAIVYAGLTGEQAGPALIDVLWGTVNPSGRLPFTIANNESDFPTTILYNSLDLHPTLSFDEKLNLDYRHFDAAGITPRFEFGFGLSYTNFTYASLSVSQGSDGGANVSFDVTNSGSVDGTEIPQLYLGFPPSAGEPPKVLRGFDDVTLTAGETKSVSMSLSTRDMSVWDTPSQSWVRPQGTFTFFVGASSRDIRLTGQL